MGQTLEIRLAMIYGEIKKDFRNEVLREWTRCFPKWMPKSGLLRNLIASMMESDVVKRLTAEEILEHRFFEKFTHGRIACSTKSLTETEVVFANIQKNYSVVSSVTPNNGLGLKSGDIIVELKGEKIGEFNLSMVRDIKKLFNLTVWRTTECRPESYTAIVNSLESFPGKEDQLQRLMVKKLASEDYLTHEQEAKIKTTFHDIDTDKDNYVSQKELSDFLGKYRYGEVDNSAAIMHAVGSNREGELSIDLSEFCEARIWGKLTSNASRVKLEFDQLDANHGSGSGTLNAEELSKGLDAPVDNLIKQLGTDEISRDEFVGRFRRRTACQ